MKFLFLCEVDIMVKPTIQKRSNLAQIALQWLPFVAHTDQARHEKTKKKMFWYDLIDI